MELNYVVDITSAYNDVLMTYGDNYQVQRYTHGIDRISMDFWMLEDHDNGWIPDGSEMNLSGERQRLYYLHDELGSVTKVIGENGKTSAHYNYDEFGRPLPSVKFDQNWPGPDNTFGYTGYQYDVSAGLWYAQARYYMPEIGRFISEDPWSGTITTPTTMNPYPYVLNNPLKYVDPLGLRNTEGPGSSGAQNNYGVWAVDKQNQSSTSINNANNKVLKQEAKNGSNVIYGELDGTGNVEKVEDIKNSLSIDDKKLSDSIGLMTLGTTGALFADDITGVGIADNILIPGVVIIGGVGYLGAKIYEAVTGMPDKHPWDKLPDSGSIPFEPPLDKAGNPQLKRGPNGGLLDEHGREWIRDKAAERVGNGHWDVQLPNGEHLNVNGSDVNNPGEINHGKGKEKGKSKNRSRGKKR